MPYRGAGPSVIADFIAGKVNFTFSTIPSIHEHVRGGRVRALGATGQRSSHLPDVPSLAEAGPAGRRFIAAVRHGGARGGAGSHRRPAERDRGRRGPGGRAHQRLIEIGYVPVGSSPAEFRAQR